MRPGTCFVNLLGVLCALVSATARAEERKTPMPRGWCYASQGPVEVRAKPAERKGALVRLGRGALVPAFEVKPAGVANWRRVAVVDPAKLAPQMGWVNSSQVETLPLSQFPLDADLLKQLGGIYLDDFTAANTAIARVLVRQRDREPALLCFLGSPVLPQARLQVYRRAQGKLVPGPFLEFPFADTQAGITGIEVRDLFDDGNECVLTREPFNLGPEHRGVNLVIRKIEAGALKTLWKAPVEIYNLGSFPPKLQVLQPPEKNIGAAGTVTKGDVDFRPRGRTSEPRWKGKVEFYALGREQPVDTVSVEKVCAWDGNKFAPLY